MPARASPAAPLEVSSAKDADGARGARPGAGAREAARSISAASISILNGLETKPSRRFVNFPVAFHRMGRQRDDRSRVPGFAGGPDQLGCLNAVHDRHLNIHQNQIEAAFAHLADYFDAVSRNGQAVAKPFHDGVHEFLVHGLVFRQ